MVVKSNSLLWNFKFRNSTSFIWVNPSYNRVYKKSSNQNFLNKITCWAKSLKGKHSFLDSLNPISPCNFDIETLSNFFLHSLLFTILLEKIENNNVILNRPNDCINHVLLYRDVSIIVITISSICWILGTSIEYICSVKSLIPFYWLILNLYLERKELKSFI